MGAVSSAPVTLRRRVAAEFLGSGFLAAVVIGSGIAAQRLSPGNTGLELLENAAATAAVSISAKHRATPAHFLSEVIATLGLLLVIFALARSGRSQSAPAAVGAYIGAAYFFTSSTNFANPAITIGRIFSDTFAGIAPSSVPSFIAAQVIGGILAAGVIKVLYPAITPADAADIIFPHHGDAGRQPRAAHDGASPSADRPGPVQSH